VLENMLVATACGGERLSFWQPARRIDAVARADALLQRFGLRDQRERKVAELPGGVRKLLDIAMALTGQPRLLLLDEPTSGVSAEEKFPMMDIIMTALGAEPMTVLFVEHDMDIVKRHADRVIAFYSGRIIADAAPAAALADDDVRRYVTGTLRTA
jgi:branched-chain amino acid transport system ATP-binding protein